MKVTITSIELKGPLKFFALSSNALKIIRQLKTTDCKQFKKRGVWTKHYTITLWNSDQELKDFASSGAHLEAMKGSKKMAKEIRTRTLDMESLPDWKTAKELLKEGNVLRFD